MLEQAVASAAATYTTVRQNKRSPELERDMAPSPPLSLENSVDKPTGKPALAQEEAPAAPAEAQPEAIHPRPGSLTLDGSELPILELSPAQDDSARDLNLATADEPDSPQSTTSVSSRALSARERNYMLGRMVAMETRVSVLEARLVSLEEENAKLREKMERKSDQPASGGALGGLGQTWSSLLVLEASIKLRMNPFQTRKSGAIIQNMQAAGYSDAQINDVCRALFLDQSEQDMRLAWRVFDTDNSGVLERQEFRAALPLMGENVPAAEIDRLFDTADTNGSNTIEFDEFVFLLKAMNPTVRGAVSGALSRPQGSETTSLFSFGNRTEGAPAEARKDGIETDGPRPKFGGRGRLEELEDADLFFEGVEGADQTSARNDKSYSYY